MSAQLAKGCGVDCTLSEADLRAIAVYLKGQPAPSGERPKPVLGRGSPDARRRSAPDVAAVITYIRNSWGNAASPISADDMASARRQPSRRTD
jgi:hypothetical protein